MTTAAQLLPPGWQEWPAEQKGKLLLTLQGVEARRRRDAWQPYPWQRPHLHPAGWEGPCQPVCLTFPKPDRIPTHGMFLQVGGRGTGKTDGATHYVLDHLDGPPCDPRAPGGHRLAIVAPTLGDAIESCVTNPLSGLVAYDPRVKHHTSTGGTYVQFPSGARAKVFGAHSPNDVERFRAGGNRCLVWLEEAAAMRYLGQIMEQSEFGLRVGPNAHYVVSTTPKALPAVRALLKSPDAVRTWGALKDAHHLPAEFRAKLEAKYAGTRTGRQEMGGELLEDVEGALWTYQLLEPYRIHPESEEFKHLAFKRIVVAVDPNAGGPDEAGIVVIGVGAEQLPDRAGRLSDHGYVLADASDHFTGSQGWAAAAVREYHRWGADAIVAEVNNGGDMVGITVRTIDPTVRYRSVTATRGKAVRAEPVVGLYEQGRMHHCGTFPTLEDQQTTWTEDAGYSPDRMDALVWAAWDALLNTRRGFASVS